jgi:FG-GAP repeat
MFGKVGAGPMSNRVRSVALAGIAFLAVLIALGGCGDSECTDDATCPGAGANGETNDGGNSDAPVGPVEGDPGAPPASPSALNVSFATKRLDFLWSDVPGATHYQLYEDPDGDGPAPYVQRGQDVTVARASASIAVHRYDWAHARYHVKACNRAGCSGPSNEIGTAGGMLPSIGYFKGSTGSNQFGVSVALSDDGNTLAVGPAGESVHVFVLSNGTWSKQAEVKASNSEAEDSFGCAIALSADGNTLAVSACAEDSSATGVGGDQANNGAKDSGAAYVFTRSGATWTQQAYVKASNTEASDFFGLSLTLSGDGNTLAVGTYFEGSSATGINGNQANNAAMAAGAVYVFTRSGATWSQQAYVKASNTAASDFFGVSVAFSADGNTLVVGAYGEDSSATTIGGPQADGATDAGAVYVFSRSGTTWSQQAYIKASNSGVGDIFGASVAISADGNTLAVGAEGEDSDALGVGSDQTNNSASSAGAVYVFSRSGTTWTQQAYVKASNTAANDHFGGTVALSADGNTLAVGAVVGVFGNVGEDSSAKGINGEETNDDAKDSGAVYVFSRSGTTWSKQAYVKASNTGAGDQFGSAIALSRDGSTMVVGARLEDSSATSVGGDQNNDSATDTGAAYLY